MIGKSTTQLVLEVFFRNPCREFHLRELSRVTRLSMPTIILVTDKLSKEGFIIKTKGKVLTTVKANRENINFIRHKRIYNLKEIYNSGVIDYLTETYNYPKCIILFGSYSRGEDIEGSDVDIAIVTSKKRELNFEKYDKILERHINIHEISLTKISAEFKANLWNGIVLEGSW